MIWHNVLAVVRWIIDVNYKLALTKSIAKDWTTKAFAICLCRDWTPCCCSCWPSTIPEGVQGGMRHSVLQGIWWDRSLDSWMVLGTYFIISILASPHILRSIKSLHGDIRPSSLTKNPFVNWVLHGIELPLHQNFVYWLSSTAALEQSLRAIWDAVSWAAVLILPQMKLNSHLSSCTSIVNFCWTLWVNSSQEASILYGLDDFYPQPLKISIF